MKARPIKGLKAAPVSQNWKKTSKRNCSEICKKLLETTNVARKTRSCRNVAERLVESPREKGGRGGGWEATQ